jgi:ABC-type molybdenum transport system ATPase subunit/photorepair protein PhrA
MKSELRSWGTSSGEASNFSKRKIGKEFSCACCETKWAIYGNRGCGKSTLLQLSFEDTKGLINLIIVKEADLDNLFEDLSRALGM